MPTDLTQRHIQRENEEIHGLRGVGVVTLVLVLAWSAVFAYALHAAMPFNPIRLPYEKRVHTRLWLPEGWGFFTRDPREEDTLLFLKRSDGAWRGASKGPHARPSNAFGLNRASRAQGIEAGLLLGTVPKAAWQACREMPARCVEHAPIAGSVRNISPQPTLCGHVGFALQKPVPWAWSTSRAKIRMPFRVARLEVHC